MSVRKATETEILKERDLDSLPHRALRLQKIESHEIYFVPNIRAFDYAREAKHSYINGFFRSSIICSSIVVEQSFIHELIGASEDWEETYWRIQVSEMTFGQLLEEARRKKVKKLKAFIKDADWLRKVRNEVAAHPTYISEYFELKDRYQLIWANRIMFRDIRRLLHFLSAQKRTEMEKSKITTKSPKGKIIRESECLEDFLSNPKKIEVDTFINWWAFESGLLGELALEVYGRMAKICCEYTHQSKISSSSNNNRPRYLGK